MKTKLKIYLLYALAILMAVATVFLLARQVAKTSQKVSTTNVTVNDLQQAVGDLKRDNQQQTVILCTLILSQNSTLSGDDVAKVEAICREKIRQTSADTAPSSLVVAPASPAPAVGSQSNPASASSNHSTSPPLEQPDNPQPTPPAPQSLIPGVDKPLVGCVTQGICL